MTNVMWLLPREDTCETSNDFDGANMGARIASVFVILVTSLFGVWFPLLSFKYKCIRMPDWCFMLAKYFGSGVIVSTAFVHLLQPANEALTNPCLGSPFTLYPWAYALCLMSLFAIFFAEACLRTFGANKMGCLDSEGCDMVSIQDKAEVKKPLEDCECADSTSDVEITEELKGSVYSQQLISLFILELGILFHSVFIGLSLAVAGSDFGLLFVVIVFHQMFEGLGLGARFAIAPWPESKKWTPWLLGLAYGLITPISVAIGLAVKNTYAPGSRTALLTVGFFDGLAAGILIYSGVIELMAKDFLFSNTFKGTDKGWPMVRAFLVMCLGAGIMSLIGRWA